MVESANEPATIATAATVPGDVPVADARPSAAQALEREILETSRRISRLRFVRGGLARLLLVRKSWVALGFVRLGDYSRERLGLAGRTLEEEARVARALEKLPRIAAAFLESQLSWTQVRLLTTVASAADELRWIDMARGCDTRTLEARVRKGAAGSNGGAPIAAAPPEDETVRFDVRVSREGRRLWRAAGEVAERTAGRPLSQAGVLELVVAEAASGAPWGAGENPIAGEATRVAPRRVQMRAPVPSPAAGEEISDHAAWLRDYQSNCLANLLAELGDPASVDDDAARDETGPGLDADALRYRASAIAGAEGLAGLLPPERGPSPAERLEALFDREEARRPRAIDARLREIGLAMQKIDAELGRLLRVALERKLHRAFGFTNFADYVEARLDLCSRKAWGLVAIARAAARCCPEFAAAFREGRLSHLAAARLLPVMGTRYGADWIERAGLVTLRRLEAEVSWALDGRDAGPAELRFDPPPPPPLDHDLASVPLPSAEEVARLQMRAPGGEAAPGCNLRFHVPRELADLAEETLLALRRGSESRGSAFERMVATVLLEWLSAPAHRDPVFARDGWRCSVPGCGSRSNLHDHHVRFRSRGGGNARDNRITVCAAHHIHGLHAGRIRASGSAPSAIVWELGCGYGDATPSARLLGDRYLMRA